MLWRVWRRDGQDLPSQRISSVLRDSRLVFFTASWWIVLLFSDFKWAPVFSYSEMCLGLSVCSWWWYGGSLRCLRVRQLLCRVVVYGFSGTSCRPSSLLIFSAWYSSGFQVMWRPCVWFLSQIYHQLILVDTEDWLYKLLLLSFGSQRQQMAMWFLRLWMATSVSHLATYISQCQARLVDLNW